MMITNGKESPHLIEECNNLLDACFPKFIANPNLYPDSFGVDDLNYKVILTEQNKVIAIGLMGPFNWSGAVEDLPTFKQMVRTGLEIQSQNHPFNSMVGYAICISPAEQGKGLSKKIVAAMKDVAKRESCTHFLVPLRPSGKHLYPLQSADEYAKWRRPDGKLVDNWLRVHENMGASRLCVMEECDVYSGPLKEWTKATGLIFPISGSYIVPGALSPLIVNVDEDFGAITEGNIWVSHPME